MDIKQKQINYLIANASSSHRIWCDSKNYEAWMFNFNKYNDYLNISKEECLDLLAANCCHCGNYIITSNTHKHPIPQNMKCHCNWEVGNKQPNYDSQQFTQMMKYDAMDTFIDIVNPVNDKDLLCEDVVGVIFEYL